MITFWSKWNKQLKILLNKLPKVHNSIFVMTLIITIIARLTHIINSYIMVHSVSTVSLLNVNLGTNWIIELVSGGIMLSGIAYIIIKDAVEDK